MIMTSAHVFTSPEPSVKVAHLLHYSQSQSVVPNKTATTTTTNSIETITCVQSESESEKDVELLRRIAFEMDHPARPTLPVLSDVKQVPSLKDSGLSQPVYMLHNCAHIELNAMDVCCHTVLMPSLLQFHLNSSRRSDSSDTLKEQTSENTAATAAATILHLPEEFYADFMRVARDEARHFQMLSDRLRELGASYGVLNSHKMLWQGAERTSNSLLARIVMCQLINECRGLDSGPRLVHKLKSSGDHASAQIMQQIVDEEEEHVRIGMKWFLALCEQMNLKPQETFQDIVSQFYGKLIPPFNHDARSRATMPRTWYEPLARRTT